MALTKSRKQFLLILALVAITLGADRLHAGATGYRSISDAVAESDVIAVGQVVAIESSSERGAGRVLLSSLEVLKGASRSESVRVAYSGLLQGDNRLLAGKRVLVFATLKPNSDELSLLSLVQGSETSLKEQLLVSSSVVTAGLEKLDRDTPLQKVIKEIANSEINTDSTEARTYLAPLAWSRVESKLTALVFQKIRSSGPKNFWFGTAGLVSLGQLEGLEALESPEAAVQSATVQQLLPTLERSYRSTSPAGTEMLSTWLQYSDVAAKRHASAGALARIHTARALLVLGPALIDKDFEVRWRVIGGMAMFANNVPIGGGGPAAGDWPYRSEDTLRFSVFDRDFVQKDEQRYLEFWWRWWEGNRASIAKLAQTEALAVRQ